MTELEELRIAWAECNRQRNELLLKHKQAALAQQKNNGLQPIETAPKDGSSIIVCDSKIGFVGEACWWDSWYSNKKIRDG